MYSLARKVFMCTTCVPPREIKMLVGADIMQTTCDSCRSSVQLKSKALTGMGENKPENPQSKDRNNRPKSKQQNLANGGYRIIFSDKHKSDKSKLILSPEKHHTKVNIRDNSLENFHGDANFKTSNNREVPESRGRAMR